MDVANVAILGPRPQDDTVLRLICIPFAGDGRAVSRADLDAWCEEVEGPCRIRVFPGDHFYIEAQGEYLLAEITATLASFLEDAKRWSHR